jgi:HPt (histidine-containing phosphotransfer) domain-containing protein
MDDYIGKLVNTNVLEQIITQWLSLENETSGPGIKNGRGCLEMEKDIPVDVDCLRESASDDPEMLKELVELYLQQAEEQLNELREAIEKGESKEIYRLAHKLVGSSATCGMIAIVPSLVELERIGREENLDGVKIHLKEAQTALNRIKAFLNESFIKQIVCI